MTHFELIPLVDGDEKDQHLPALGSLNITTIGTAGCYLYLYWITHHSSMAMRMMMHDYDDARHSWTYLYLYWIAHESGSGCLRSRHRMIFDLPAHHSSVTEMRRMSGSRCLQLRYSTEWYLIIYRPWERQRMLTITTQNDIWSTCSPLIGDRDEEDEQQWMLTIMILDRMIFDHLLPIRLAADTYDYDTEWY